MSARSRFERLHVLYIYTRSWRYTSLYMYVTYHTMNVIVHHNLCIYLVHYDVVIAMCVPPRLHTHVSSHNTHTLTGSCPNCWDRFRLSVYTRKILSFCDGSRVDSCYFAGAKSRVRLGPWGRIIAVTRWKKGEFVPPRAFAQRGGTVCKHGNSYVLHERKLKNEERKKCWTAE